MENKRGVTSKKGSILSKGKSKKVGEVVWLLRVVPKEDMQDVGWVNTVEESGLKDIGEGSNVRKVLQ